VLDSTNAASSSEQPSDSPLALCPRMSAPSTPSAPGWTRGPISGEWPQGCTAKGYDLQLTQYYERGLRVTFYTTGMEHSPTSATGAEMGLMLWQAAQRATCEALRSWARTVVSTQEATMATPHWVKKLGGHAGELYVAAELSKRSIPNALLPENLSDDDLLAGSKDGTRQCFVQVKSCHPDRADSFILRESDERWHEASANRFVVFVWLGSPAKNEAPRYWVAPKSEVGLACIGHRSHGTPNWERRFYPQDLPPAWENNWPAIETHIRAHDSVA